MQALIANHERPTRRPLPPDLERYGLAARQASRLAPVVVGHLEIDPLGRELRAHGKPVDLTALEFDLLAFLAARPGQVFSRDDLLRDVWKSSPDWQQTATVTEHVRRLRIKIELDGQHPTLIHTVRGAGYRFDVPEVPPSGARV